MAPIIISDLPGDAQGDGWKRYRAATDELYARCGSDRIYEDVMNGLCFLDADDNPVYISE